MIKLLITAYLPNVVAYTRAMINAVDFIETELHSTLHHEHFVACYPDPDTNAFCVVFTATLHNDTAPTLCMVGHDDVTYKLQRCVM